MNAKNLFTLIAGLLVLACIAFVIAAACSLWAGEMWLAFTRCCGAVLLILLGAWMLESSKP